MEPEAEAAVGGEEMCEEGHDEQLGREEHVVGTRAVEAEVVELKVKKPSKS